MIRSVQNHLDRWLGRGAASIAVPPFDGALKPNQRLESAEVVVTDAALEDLASDGDRLWIAAGNRLLTLEGGAMCQVKAFDAPISALACLPRGGFAVALRGREVRVYAQAADETPIAAFSGTTLRSINALSVSATGDLLATDGSATQNNDDWARDLLERGRTGRVLRFEPKSGEVRELASGLQYAFGVCANGNDMLVSESWRSRVIAISGSGTLRAALDNLPVYPSRLSPAAAGGYWLTAFTARTQLIEFVLREAAYRKRMMAEIDPAFWIVPRLRGGQSFMEPMQGAHLKTMGVVKPWAPPRSYGLVIRLSPAASPLYSLHSRVDADNHGVVAAVEVGDDLFALAKGPGRLLRISLSSLAREFAT